MNKTITLLLLPIFIFGCAHSDQDAQDPSSLLLKALSSNSRRTKKEISRNKYRHPVKTLSFFGIQQDMKVIEISPGGGWYTSILGPYLRDKGELYLAIFAETSEKGYRKRLNKSLKERIAESPDIYGEVKYTVFDSPKNIGPIAKKDSSIDMILTFRNTHGWMRDKTAKKAYKEFFRVLKPGGTLGVVQHRETKDKAQDPEAKSGYITEKAMIALAESAGFYLDSKSEINANPKDTKDYEKGVWTLPPVLRMKEESKEKYLDIGESDRMTLKFIKPTK